MKYDPKRVSVKHIDNDQAAWLIENKGGWMVFGRGPEGDHWGDWYHFWPDGQKPEGVFLDEAEAREWIKGTEEYVKAKGSRCEIVLVKIAPQEKIVVISRMPVGVKEWRPPETIVNGGP
jgi:hypothetical protein